MRMCMHMYFQMDSFASSLSLRLNAVCVCTFCCDANFSPSDQFIHSISIVIGTVIVISYKLPPNLKVWPRARMTSYIQTKNACWEDILVRVYLYRLLSILRKNSTIWMFFHSINWVCSNSLVDLKQMKNWWNDDRHIQIVGSTLERWFINKSNYYDDVKRKDARKHALTRSLAYLLVHTHLHVIHKRREYTTAHYIYMYVYDKIQSGKRRMNKKT